MFSKKDRYVNKIEGVLTGLRVKYEGKIEQNRITLQDTKFDLPGNENEKNKILFDTELQGLYLIYVNYLLAYVKLLPKLKGGRRRSKKNNRRNIKRTIKRRGRGNPRFTAQLPN